MCSPRAPRDCGAPVSPQHVGTQISCLWEAQENCCKSLHECTFPLNIPDCQVFLLIFFHARWRAWTFWGELCSCWFCGGNLHFKKPLVLPQGNEKIQILNFFGLHALKFRWWLSCRGGQGWRAQGMGTSQANSSSCLASVGEMQQILDFSGAKMWLSGHQ